MGLFGPPRDFRQRSFTMPCTRQEAMQVLSETEALYGEKPFEMITDAPASQPPLSDEVYLESIGDNGFIIAAGNRVRTYWRVQLTLSGDNPTMGTFGSIEHNSSMWPGNGTMMKFALERAIDGVGGRRHRWP